MMVIGLFRSQGIELPEKNITELSVQERSKLFNRGTFYLSCGMTIAQYEKMEKTNKVMFTREVVFKNYEGNWYMGKELISHGEIKTISLY